MPRSTQCCPVTREPLRWPGWTTLPWWDVCPRGCAKRLCCEPLSSLWKEKSITQSEPFCHLQVLSLIKVLHSKQGAIPWWLMMQSTVHDKRITQKKMPFKLSLHYCGGRCTSTPLSFYYAAESLVSDHLKTKRANAQTTPSQGQNYKNGVSCVLYIHTVTQSILCWIFLMYVVTMHHQTTVDKNLKTICSS